MSGKMRDSDTHRVRTKGRVKVTHTTGVGRDERSNDKIVGVVGVSLHLVSVPRSLSRTGSRSRCQKSRTTYWTRDPEVP